MSKFNINISKQITTSIHRDRRAVEQIHIASIVRTPASVPQKTFSGIILITYPAVDVNSYGAGIVMKEFDKGHR